MPSIPPLIHTPCHYHNYHMPLILHHNQINSASFSDFCMHPFIRMCSTVRCLNCSCPCFCGVESSRLCVINLIVSQQFWCINFLGFLIGGWRGESYLWVLKVPVHKENILSISNSSGVLLCHQLHM